MYKLVYKEDGHFNGFYLEGFHEVIPEKHINITEALWQKLLSKMYKLKSTRVLDKNTIYSLNNIDLFEEYTIEHSDQSKVPTLQERMVSLENENIELLKNNFDLDFRLFEIECIIEYSSPKIINLKENKVRTQYEQAKKLIISDAYERLDMEYKLSRYKDSNVITIKQYNELVVLMNIK